MLVTLKNDFHNTTARVRYPGGVHPIPVGALRKLCPSRGCLCLGSPAGEPYPHEEDGVEVYFDIYLGRWVIAPAES
jgi:hypothetical protein